MKRLRIGLIGTGNMGMGHVRCIAAIPGLQLVAVADPHAASLETFRSHAASKGVTCYGDYREMLAAADLDAVIIAAPDYLHVDMTLDAMKAGKHVLCEKPAVTTRADLDRLVLAVAAAKTIYQVGLEVRHCELARRLWKLSTDGTLVSPRLIWCKEFRRPFLSKVGQWIHFQDKTGGVFVEKTCHFFDLMTWMSGSLPRKVIALAGQDVVKEIYGVRPDVFDNGWVIVEYANGVRACLGLCMFDQAQEGVEFGVTGDRGRAVMLLDKQRIELCEFRQGDDQTAVRSEIAIDVPPDIVTLSHMGGVYYELLDFLENIRTGRPPLTGIEAARWSTLIGLAAEESARQGGTPVTF